MATPAKPDVTREILFAQLPDNRWRTVYDMAVTFNRRSVLPVESVLRASPLSTGTPDERLIASYVKLLRPLVETLASPAIGMMERDGDDDLAQYRRIDDSLAQHLRMAGRDELDRPADTDTGISQRIIYRLLHDKSPRTEEEIFELLQPCFKPDADLIAWYKRQRQKNVKHADQYDADKIRRAVMSHYLTACVSHGKVRRETSIKYELVLNGGTDDQK